MTNKKTLKGIILGFLLCIFYVVSRKILLSIFQDNNIFAIARLILQSGIFLVGYYCIKKLFDINLWFTTNGLTKGIFRYGAIVFLVVLANLIGTYTVPEISVAAAAPKIASILVSMLGVGLAEEIIFRGVLFNAYKEYFGDTKSGIFKTLFVSSVLFGSIHLINLISYPNLVVSTTAQVIYATFYGFLMGIVYYRSNNIWAVIILHCLVDFSNAFWLGFSHEGMGISVHEGRQDISVMDGAILVLAMSPLLISALIQLNNAFKKRSLLG